MRTIILGMLLVFSCSTILHGQPHENPKPRQKKQEPEGEARPKTQPKKRSRSSSNPGDALPFGFFMALLAKGSM